MSAPPHVLYVRRACEHCAEAEALLQGEGIAYVRVRVEPSADPGFVRLIHPDGRIERMRHTGHFPTPALVDVEANVTLIGKDQIEAHLDDL